MIRKVWMKRLITLIFHIDTIVNDIGSRKSHRNVNDNKVLLKVNDKNSRKVLQKREGQ